MPIAKVETPDGTIIQVEYPEGATEEQIYSFAAQQYDASKPKRPVGPLFAATKGFADALTFGLSGEIGAGLESALRYPFSDKSIGQLYDDAYSSRRAQEQVLQEKYPNISTASNMAGGLVTGGLATKAGGTALARAMQSAPVKTQALLGGATGAAYGFGSSEGDVGERLESAGTAGLVGGVAGPLVGEVTKLANPAARFLKQQFPQVFNRSGLQAKAERAAVDEVSDIIARRPQQLVLNKLKKDFPSDYKKILDGWRQSNVPLAEYVATLKPSQTVTLAQGAAQYPSGKAAAEQFFEKRLAETPSILKAAVSRDINPTANALDEIDAIVKRGQELASPFYKKAEKVIVPARSPLFKSKVVQEAIIKARATYPDTLGKTKFNSIATLDGAKKVLDDEIQSAIRAGERNLAADRMRARNLILNAVSENKDYAKARKIATDYFGAEQAFKDGARYDKLGTEEFVRMVRNASESEKQAIELAMARRVRENLDNVVDGRNPYNKVLGTESARKNMRLVLGKKEYANFERTIKAENELFKMRNTVLGNSQTAGKQIAAAELKQGGGEMLAQMATGDLRGAGVGAIRGVVRRVFDGLDDKTAGEVAKLIFESDPKRKLLLINNIDKSAQFTAAERVTIKQAYFKADILTRPTVAAIVAGGAQAGAATVEE